MTPKKIVLIAFGSLGELIYPAKLVHQKTGVPCLNRFGGWASRGVKEFAKRKAAGARSWSTHPAGNGCKNSL
jgi:hypothetical protein